MEEKKDSLARCDGCVSNSSKDKKSVPYIVHEGNLARMERSNRRLWILCIVIFLAFAVSNAAWMWYENQFEDVVTTIDSQQDGSGTNIFGGGDVNYEPTN